MRNLLKNIFTALFLPSAQIEAQSIQKLVSFNSLNKRKNLRIRYPHFGALGPYPRMYYCGSEMRVGNISVGGLHVRDDQELLGPTLGEVVKIDLVWDDNFKAKVNARLVGVNKNSRHLQFVDFDPQSFLRISQLTKSGHLGGRFHRVPNSNGKIEAKELWVGPTSESIIFHKDNSQVEFYRKNESLIFEFGKKCTFKNKSAPVPRTLLDEALIVFANLPETTPLVHDLLEIVKDEMTANPQRKTGT